METETLGWAQGRTRRPHTKERTMLAFHVFGTKEIVVYIVVVVVIVIAAVWYLMRRRTKV